MPGEAWIGDEPRAGAVAARVFARARRRAGRVLAIAVLVTAAVVAARALRTPTYLGALHFRLAEGELVDPTLAPRPPRDVRAHIATVALSRQQLAAIMRAHGVSEAWLGHDPEAAVDEFRERIGVDVERNYFVEDRSRRGEPRSAFVTVSLLGTDPEQTRAILRDIGDAILADQGTGRSGSLAGARAVLGEEARRARERVRALEDEIAALEAQARRADARTGIDLRGRVAALRIEALGAVERVLALERRAEAVEFSGAAEGEQLGLSFRLLDEHVTALAPPLAAPALAARAAAILGATLLLAAVVVGAFDDRIYGLEDLAARGLPVLGALSRFPGDDAGSYRARALARGAGVRP